MPKSITDFFRLDKASFESTGALDALLDLDTRLFVDPHLLEGATTPELHGAHNTFRQHFANLLQVLNASREKGDAFWREADRMLVFPEVQGLCIGYGKHGTAGSGMGLELRSRLLTTAKEIVDAGIREPEIFELIGLFEEDIGADRVSDMTARVIRNHLYSLSQRVFNELGLEGTLREGDYALPRNPYNGKSVILVPEEILRPLPVAHDWSDVDVVCAANRALRNRVNRIIGNTWKYATTRVLKADLKRTLLTNPDLVRDLINQYKGKPVARHDFDTEPMGEAAWHSVASKFVRDQPLSLSLSSEPTAEEVLSIVFRICERFKRAIELHGWSRLLYKIDGSPHHESVSQVLFYVLADAYCEANNLELSRESNAGRGPVDFKVSRGYRSRVLVEVKLSSNKRLVHGLEKQVEEYRKAESAFLVIMIVIDVGNPGQWRERLNDAKSRIQRAGQRAPDIYDIDGQRRESASRV